MPESRTTQQFKKLKAKHEQVATLNHFSCPSRIASSFALGLWFGRLRTQTYLRMLIHATDVDIAGFVLTAFFWQQKTAKIPASNSN